MGMSGDALRDNESLLSRGTREAERRNLGGDQPNGDGIDREAVLHRRRKDSMISLLSEFEKEIERHVKPGHEREIEHFKRSCRRKLNGLTFLACELLKLRPGESVNEAVADLAEELAFDANGGHNKS